MKRLILAALLVAVVAQYEALGSGMLIPKDKSLPPLAVKHQRVDIRIKDGVASARIEQVFKNSVNRNLEAVFVFPLPENASISDFAMYINGKRMSGELVEKGKARKIYEDIVRRMKDPGLLEHMGGNLFRISVFPVLANGEQKIELEYSQALDFEAGLYNYTYPLKTGKQASRTLEDFTVSVRLNSSLPIKNIYSPSHKVGISRKGENEAVIGFEQEHALLDKDFVLFYGVSKKDFGLNLITHSVKKQDGYFMMMLAPAVQVPDADAIEKDITFVIDTSGSMSGTKIKQAKEAMDYCVRKLNKGDRFNIVRFSTDVELFKDALVEVTDESRDEALGFIERLEARGGTDINGALLAALDMEYKPERPAIIAFMTDGKPTIGESDPGSIVSNVAGRNKSTARIFVFGVGHGVNARLLDEVSGGNGGVSRYVEPDEDIEVKLSSFSDKMSHPVLAGLDITVDKVKVKQMHPRSLPDLFSGDQLSLFGRYDGSGHVAIRLTGEVNGKKREFVYETTFPKTNPENEFIPRLWATRRVGYLLDEIRLHGEKSELKDEVLKLSKEHGIMTPYTSYLVLEDEQAYVTHGVRDRRLPPSPTEPAPQPILSAGEAPSVWADSAPAARSGRDSSARKESKSRSQAVPVFEAPSGGAADRDGDRMDWEGFSYSRTAKGDVDDYMSQDSGKDAVRFSKAIRRYKDAEREEQELETVRNVGGKNFYLVDGRWVDSEYKKDMKTVKIKFASEDYFELLKKQPDLKKYLSLGEKVTVVLEDGTALVVE